jgi:RNA polymerase-binding protein DksA
MARKLAKSTVNRFKKRLDDERERLQGVIDEIELEREEVRISETSSERSPDPNTAEGGSLAFELEKELSVAQNAEDLLAKVDHARDQIRRGKYGICEVCGAAIPIERLEALPYTTTCVECASNR